MSRLRLVLLPPLLVVTGCATGLLGRYDLQTLNDETLPITGMIFNIAALELQLNEDGTCVASTYTDSSSTPDIDDDCSWSSEGTIVTLLAPDNQTFRGTVEDGTLTLTAEGFTMVFGRR